MTPEPRLVSLCDDLRTSSSTTIFSCRVRSYTAMSLLFAVAAVNIFLTQYMCLHGCVRDNPPPVFPSFDSKCDLCFRSFVVSCTTPHVFAVISLGHHLPAIFLSISCRQWRLPLHSSLMSDLLDFSIFSRLRHNSFSPSTGAHVHHGQIWALIAMAKKRSMACSGQFLRLAADQPFLHQREHRAAFWQPAQTFHLLSWIILLLRNISSSTMLPHHIVHFPHVV